MKHNVTYEELLNFNYFKGHLGVLILKQKSKKIFKISVKTNPPPMNKSSNASLGSSWPSGWPPTTSAGGPASWGCGEHPPRAGRYPSFHTPFCSRGQYRTCCFHQMILKVKRELINCLQHFI